MKNILTSKMTLMMAVFGAILSLLLSLFSKSNALQLIIRMLLSTLIMGGIAILIQFLVNKFIPQEHLNILIKGNNESENPESSLKQNNSSSTGNSIDYTDKGGLSAEDLYKSSEDEIPLPEKSNTISHTKKPSVKTADISDMFPINNASNTTPATDSVAQEDSFQSTDFSEAPRIKIQEPSSEESSLKEKAMPFDDNTQNVSPPQEKSSYRPSPPASSESDREVSFTVKNKKISADPKLIAKAIKTVLHKD